MKTMRFLALAAFTFVGVAAAVAQTTYTWNVASGGFATAGSWNPSRGTPAATDILVFDGSVQASPTATGVTGAATMGQLRFINNVTATLTGASAGSIAPQSTGAIDSGNEAFFVGAGSTVRFNGGVTQIQLQSAGGQKYANIYGTFIFAGASGSGNRMIGYGPGSIVFQTGSKCYAAPSAATTVGVFGVVGGSPTTVQDGVIFKTGSQYIHGVNELGVRSAANYREPHQMAAPAQMCVFETGSEAIFWQTSGFAPVNRRYSDLTCRSNVAEINSGIPAAVRNLNIKNNGTATQAIFQFGGSATFNVSGAITIDADSGGFRDGGSGRVITAANGIFANGLFELNGNTVAGNLEVGPTGSVTATGNGGVLGTVTRDIAAGAGSYNFPVKSATTSRNVVLASNASAPGQVVVDYIQSTPGTNGLPLVDGALTANRIAEEGYWSITDPTNVDGNYDLTLSAAGITPQFSDATQARVAKRADSSQPWALEGAAGASAGTNVVQTGLSGFSEFAVVGPDAQVPVTVSGFSID